MLILFNYCKGHTSPSAILLIDEPTEIPASIKSFITLTNALTKEPLITVLVPPVISTKDSSLTFFVHYTP